MKPTRSNCAAVGGQFTYATAYRGAGYEGMYRTAEEANASAHWRAVTGPDGKPLRFPSPEEAETAAAACCAALVAGGRKIAPAHG